jgi:glycosyltransferase involved in cell wall biosynthesis
LAPALYPAWAARRRRAEFIVSPRGMLSPAALAFSRTRKQVFWRLFQRRALESAACLHATSEAELEDIRAAGLRNPVAVIPNGVDLAEPTGAVRPSGLRTILSLGRIHPKKGLDQLVRAWARLEAGAPQWRLRIVGPAELGHDRELAGLAASLGLTRLSIEGPAYGPEKQAAYEQSDLFVLPTRGENFAMTVAEALAAGAPVISTKGAPWKGLQTNGCGWWTDHGAEALAAAMQAAMAKPADELSAMGARGRAWMARDFGWRRIAEDMLEVYRWTTLGGSPPPTVRLV